MKLSNCASFRLSPINDHKSSYSFALPVFDALSGTSGIVLYHLIITNERECSIPLPGFNV